VRVVRSRYLLKAVLSVCLSVCPSITLVSHAYAVQDMEINFIPYDRAMYLVSNLSNLCVPELGIHPERVS